MVRATALALGVACAPAQASQPASPPVPPAASPAFTAEAVRAAYIINFIRFTEWPESHAYGPVVVGVVGDRMLEDELIRLADRQGVAGRSVRVIRAKNLRDLQTSHVVYFSPAPTLGDESAPGAATALPLLRELPVLTISESPAFLGQGGIINLYREEEKLRFEIAPEAAARARLTLSARLLKLARIFRVED
ncbi:MAG: YfiR family protein [Opitutaceae bacterium]|nr:YfiR family protein [Opitutaceae bacterium]